MQQNGIQSDQVTQVRGFADQRRPMPNTPLDATKDARPVAVAPEVAPARGDEKCAGGRREDE